MEMSQNLLLFVKESIRFNTLLFKLSLMVLPSIIATKNKINRHKILILVMRASYSLDDG